MTPLPPVNKDIEDDDSPRKVVLKAYLKQIEEQLAAVTAEKERLARQNRHLVHQNKSISEENKALKSLIVKVRENAA